jgi:large subunit ribosomal protein L25
MIPAEFSLDISGLDIGDGFHVSDLTMPEGVESATSAALPIVTVVAPKAEKVEEEVEVEGAEGEAAPADGAKKEEGKTAEGGEKKA